MSELPDPIERARAAVTAVAPGLIGAGASVARTLSGLRPTTDELAEMVVPEAIDALTAHLDRIYRPGATPGVPEGHTQLEIVVCMAGLLREDNTFSRRFPGGYRRIAPALLPLVAWSCAVFTAHGEPATRVRLAGLVWTGDRVVFVPKPYRALRRASAH